MPARTRWWWTLAVASRLGIAACVSLTPLSLRTSTAEPPFTALSAFSHSLRRASSIPLSPVETGKRVESVVEVARSSPRARIFSSSSAVRTGWSMRTRRQCFLRLVEEVLLRAQAHLERHDELLAQGVYGRVGDLREVLLEVREQELRPLGEDGQRRVRAHRAVGLLAVLGHRGEEYALVLDGVAEGPLALQEAGRLGTRVGIGARGARSGGSPPPPATRGKAAARTTAS